MLHPKNPKRSPQEALLFYQQQQQQQKKEKQQNQQQQQKRGRSMASDPCSLSDGDYGSFSCSKRLRRPNFKFQELEMMVSLLEERPELASGKIGGAYINADAQRQAWQELATLIGAVGEVQRSAREIREKWIDYKSRVKQKLRKIRDQEEGHAEPGALPTTLTPLELRIIDLAKRNARHCNEDPDLYINCYEGPEPTTTHGSYQHPECPSFKATTGNFTGSKSQDTRQKQSLLHPELTINLLDDDRSGEDDDVEDEEELVEDDDEEEDVETDLQTQRLQSRSNKDSNGAPATTMVDSKSIIMTPSPELVPNDATPMVLSSANGPSSRTHSEFQGYSRDSSESSFTALTNEDDGGGDSSAVAATSAPEEFQGTLTERLLSHLAHKQDRVVGLLTELTEETYRRRTIEEETLGLLRTLVALQARRVELEELKMGLSSEELTRRTMTNHSAAQGSRTSK